MKASRLIKKFRMMGFSLKTDGVKIQWEYLEGAPDPEKTKKFLSLLKENKAEVIKELKNEINMHLMAVDIETTGLNPRENSIKLISWADSSESGASTNVDCLKDKLADSSLQKVFHNAAFDVPFLETKGFPVNNYTDTMIMSQVLGKKYQRHSLKAVLKRELNIEISKKLQKASNWQGELIEKHYHYAENDAKMTFRLAEHLLNKIIDNNLYEVFKRNENALPQLVRLIKDGLYVDVNQWSDELEKYEIKKDEIEKSILEELNSTINLNSHQQLKYALNNRGAKVANTKDETLAKYEEEFPVITKIRKYKKFQKLTSSNTKFIDFADGDGRVRANWKLFGSITGRMSCSKPNLQQMSYQFRKCIKPEEGNKFVGCDYSQVELRVVSSLAQDRRMINAFKEGKDLHLTTAQLIYDKENISNEERQIAKTCNFGLIYGMGADGLKRRLKQMIGMDIKLGEARKLRTKFLSSYKGLRRWQEKLLLKNYIKTLGGKRWSTKRLNTQELFNYPVQGSAAEGLKETMIVMNKKLPDNWKLVALIHDEILLEVPEAEAKKALKELKKWMIAGMGQIVKDVPIKVDGIIADYWKKS